MTKPLLTEAEILEAYSHPKPIHDIPFEGHQLEVAGRYGIALAEHKKTTEWALKIVNEWLNERISYERMAELLGVNFYELRELIREELEDVK